MDNFLLIIILIAVALMVFIVMAVILILKSSRKSKAVERSLKLVPLLIKIPPREATKDGRDGHEQIQTNIAKAEGVYRLLSGIAAKHSKVHGQRYVGFEIVAKAKQIFFYVAVPVSLLEPIKKALASGYPGIQIEQKEEVNFFSKESKISGVAGGEFELKKSS